MDRIIKDAYSSIDGVKEFAGTLKSYDSTSVTVTINDKDETFLRKEISFRSFIVNIVVIKVIGVNL